MRPEVAADVRTSNTTLRPNTMQGSEVLNVDLACATGVTGDPHAQDTALVQNTSLSSTTRQSSELFLAHEIRNNQLLCPIGAPGVSSVQDELTNPAPPLAPANCDKAIQCTLPCTPKAQLSMNSDERNSGKEEDSLLGLLSGLGAPTTGGTPDFSCLFSTPERCTLLDSPIQHLLDTPILTSGTTDTLNTPMRPTQVIAGESSGRQSRESQSENIASSGDALEGTTWMSLATAEDAALADHKDKRTSHPNVFTSGDPTSSQKTLQDDSAKTLRSCVDSFPPRNGDWDPAVQGQVEVPVGMQRVSTRAGEEDPSEGRLDLEDSKATESLAGDSSIHDLLFTKQAAPTPVVSTGLQSGFCGNKVTGFNPTGRDLLFTRQAAAPTPVVRTDLQSELCGNAVTEFNLLRPSGDLLDPSTSSTTLNNQVDSDLVNLPTSIPQNRFSTAPFWVNIHSSCQNSVPAKGPRDVLWGASSLLRGEPNTRDRVPWRIPKPKKKQPKQRKRCDMRTEDERAVQALMDSQETDLLR